MAPAIAGLRVESSRTGKFRCSWVPVPLQTEWILSIRAGSSTNRQVTTSGVGGRRKSCFSPILWKKRRCSGKIIMVAAEPRIVIGCGRAGSCSESPFVSFFLKGEIDVRIVGIGNDRSSSVWFCPSTSLLLRPPAESARYGRSGWWIYLRSHFLREGARRLPWRGPGEGGLGCSGDRGAVAGGASFRRAAF